MTRVVAERKKDGWLSLRVVRSLNGKHMSETGVLLCPEDARLAYLAISRAVAAPAEASHTVELSPSFVAL